MGRRHQALSNAKGRIREAIIQLRSRRLIQRPISLLIPLELEDEAMPFHHYIETTEVPSSGPTTDNQEARSNDNNIVLSTTSSRYNLKKRRTINYNEHGDTTRSSFEDISSTSNLLQISLVRLLAGPVMSNINKLSYNWRIQCIQGGINQYSSEETPYEICAEQYSVQMDNPAINETIRFPAEIVLH
ncbi:hypothetical protein RB195_022078 [Necator americanus]